MPSYFDTRWRHFVSKAQVDTCHTTWRKHLSCGVTCMSSSGVSCIKSWRVSEHLAVTCIAHAVSLSLSLSLSHVSSALTCVAESVTCVTQHLHMHRTSCRMYRTASSCSHTPLHLHTYSYLQTYFYQHTYVCCINIHIRCIHIRICPVIRHSLCLHTHRHVHIRMYRDTACYLPIVLFAYPYTCIYALWYSKPPGRIVYKHIQT